ncbi:fibronectin type III domain-containing protein 11-like isoform X1 [Thunnus thynnus]|uniref:fibronectin type III domain-containing protein 11-like isoform X1 n=2 Tax=Thunnus thynnus TaxID=8237 RepID=UPI003527B7E9
MFIRSITMDEVKLACTSSNECGAQEASSQKDTLLDLHNQIAHLFCTRLSENSIMVIQEKLQLMQRSSYYLEIQHDDSLPTADQQQQTLNLSDSTVLSLIDQRKLRRAMTLANTQVKLLLTLLGMLYEEIISGCRELEVFIIKYDQGLVDSDMAASTQEKLQRTHQYLNDFESRLTRNLGPLDLQNQLILNTGQYPMPQLSASLAIKMPVMFDRCESRVTSNAAHLCWGVASQQSKEPCQEFEIHMKSLHPTADQDQFIKSTCQSYSIHFNNLTPDRYYQFSVKRVDTVNLVYGLWTDTIILKTVSVFK